MNFKFLLPRLWLQGDNCPREVRNSLTAKFCISMVQGGFFSAATMAHLEVGHTHEDVGRVQRFVTFRSMGLCTAFMFLTDACLSVVRSALSTCPNLHTIRDIQRTGSDVSATSYPHHGSSCRSLQQKLPATFEKQGLECIVEVIETVACLHA